MALVNTKRNNIDQKIDEYKGKPKYILLAMDDYFKFRDELRALNLYTPPQTDKALMSEVINYRGLRVIVCLDFQDIEVVG